MNIIVKYIRPLYLPVRFYNCGIGLLIAFVTSFFFPLMLSFAWILFGLFIILFLADYILLFSIPPPHVVRHVSDRLSIGDENQVTLKIRNRSSARLNLKIVDEIPEQFEDRDFSIHRNIKGLQSITIKYMLRPLSRGIYEFGDVRIFLSSIVGLVSRRYSVEGDMEIPVYPSFMAVRKYQLISQTGVTTAAGSRRLRKIGHSMEFEQIREYVTGDDIRNLNWKATARKGSLMVNNFSDERSQQVYCFIDKGRLMKMPFKGLTLLDHAINSTLVMANVCLQKKDKFGMLTFSDKMGDLIPADRRMIQREHILQALYKQTTGFLESDYEMLYSQVRNKIKTRSLIILYTNFESLNGLKRQLPYLRSMARYHLLLVVFFENSELKKLTGEDAHSVEDVYVKTIAEKFSFEKRLIARELQSYGILSILTTPENLTLNTVNKYLEVKARQAI